MAKGKLEQLTPEQQNQLFQKTAREIGTDESEGAFDNVLRKVASAPPPETIKRRKADIERRKKLVPRRKPKAKG